LVAFNGSPILLEESTLSAFATLWGTPDPKAVKVVKREEILETAWNTQPSWALIPFEELQPRWKVLKVNGTSPLDKSFSTDTYPLIVHFGIVAPNPGLTDPNAHLNLPISNYDSSKMTSLILTGTTAMVRYFALRMEEKGITYPAQDIAAILKGADILHISNEVSFWEDCPSAQPVRREMRFCSDPSYIELLKYVGTDVIELTGNHLLDWGEEPFVYTLKLYEENKLPVYGGGLNREDAQRPLLMEYNGNRFAFLGCNAVGPEIALATDEHPGAAPCDLNKMKEQIAALLEKGIIPIVTFQHFEAEMFTPQSSQRVDFQAIAQAGAVIVSGSQAHYPQGMTFVDGRFVHYGLGNLFFDQMDKWNRQAFIDRHIFYNGRHISTELITIILEDYARPRLMTSQEREKLLKRVFGECVW
ncbi:MAG: CapA family protein, partial [Anaerolineales bacterium]